MEVHAGVDGPVVVRRGTGADDVDHLRATAARLAAAAHPGVVEVVRSEGTEDWWELELVHAGRPLESLGRLTIDQVAAVTAGLAATVADLHAAGIVHGAIDASHVLVSGHGRPVLCGFGPRDDEVDAAGLPAEDVAAIGELIATLVGNDAELEQLPERRWSRPSLRNREGWARRTLLLVADHACAEPPTRRPSAARLAVEIAEAVPGSSSPTWSTADPPPGERPVDPAVDRAAVAVAAGSRLPSLASAALGVIVLAVMALALVMPAVDGGATKVSSHPAADSEGAIAPPTTNATTTTTVRSSGTPRAVTTVVEGGRRYAVGAPGDIVVLGDWDGDGQRTAAVLRPSTGEVFVFSTWSTGEDVIVRAATVVPGAAELVVVQGDGHERLVVRRVDGTEVPVSEAVA